MRELRALIRAHWRTRTSYRVQTVLGLLGVLVSVVPLFFIAGALQPLAAGAIRGEAEHYFGFVVVGTVAAYVIQGAVMTLPAAVAGGIGRGTLEALLGTPVPLPVLLFGLIGADLLWIGARVVLLLGACWLLGGGIEAASLPLAIAILLLILLAHLPFGLMAAALVLVLRTTGPLPQAVLYASILLGGVYYPTHVIPSWLQDLSAAVPLSYGLRALRMSLLEGASFSAVALDVVVLTAWGAGLALVGGLALAAAFRYARRAGTLAQY